MKTEDARIILGFFPAGADEHAREVLAASPAHPEVFLSSSSSETSARIAAPFAALRLPRETLAVARCSAEDSGPLVRLLRTSGATAVFVLRESPDAPKTSESPEPEEALRGQEDIFRRALRDLEEAQRLEHALNSAAEWLIDNSYLVLTNLADMRRDLTQQHSKLFPPDAGESTRKMRALAAKLVANTDCSIQPAAIEEVLSDPEVSAKVTMRDLWLFPFLLRWSTIEAITAIAVRVSRAQQWREAAYLWANRLASSARVSEEQFARMLALLEQRSYATEPYFIVSLAEQLHDEESALAGAQRWMEARLAKPLTEAVQTEHTREAAERVSTANAFGSLRALARLDFYEVFEAVSQVERELCKDPAGVYPKSDASTRDDCRRVVEKIARYSSASELQVARRATALAGQSGHDVTYFLLSEGVDSLEQQVGARAPLRMRATRFVRRHAVAFYLLSQIVLNGCFTALALMIAWDAGVHRPAALAILGALALFPLSELSIQIVNALVVSLLPPLRLAKLDFRKRIPDEDATLVIVPMMLASVETIRLELEKLEVRFLANQNANLWFGLFADFLDAEEASAPRDAEFLKTAREGIAGLNRRYPGRFVFFHRPRQWSESEQRWIGRERKRGKLDELNSFLTGRGAPDILVSGQLPLPIRYVLTLDSDTALPPGAARRLVETIAHPLNRAVLDPQTKVCRRGYTIIQPRVSVSLPDAMATRFTRVFADASGTDPYCKSVSDAQQDLFGEAIFHGKAIYDVNAFNEALNDRFPSETLLSHDLIEGAYAGAALANDIELFENVPHSYSSYSRREHRWIRGDWQIAPWIFPRVPAAKGREPNPLTLLNRWRIFDNLRRSLVPIASLLLLILGWLISAAPGVWSLVVALAIAIPALAPLLERWAHRIDGSVHGWHGAADQLIRAVVKIAFLPHSAWIAGDAIARALFRSHFSHRNLLEWETAASARANSHLHMSATLRQMLMICAGSLVLLIVLAETGAFFPTFAFLALWVTSPILMLWLTAAGFPNRRVEGDEALLLRRLARRTWRFFDDLVGPENNWLPPDNSQLALRVEVARRTSPTNIGMWLTSALAARDLGYLSPDEFWRRTDRTMDTLGRLERYEGHWLNWYNTETLDPLTPRYVSTVDSGNLLASFWVLRQGCREILSAPVLSESCLRGLYDTVAVVRELCGRDPVFVEPLRELRRLFHGTAEGHALIARIRLATASVEHLKRPFTDERSYWISRLAAELASWTEIIERYLLWMETLAYPTDAMLEPLSPDMPRLRRRAMHAAPSLAALAATTPNALESILSRRGTPELPPDLAAWLDRLAAEFAEAQRNAAEMVKKFEALSSAAEAFANGINMRFLYDAPRHLFGVGYAVGGPVEFTSHYDLLASECRLASLAAIAKGDVPTDHWSALGRTRSPSDDGPVLLSWSGTMFEYLMPALFVRSFTGSLLDRACRQAVQQQMEHGRAENLPWGVSESAFSALDINQIYQYRAFGVQSLALKRGVEDEQVVAPYATMLALLIDPAAAIQNIERLERLGLAGPMGLYESIDFSRDKTPSGAKGVVVYTYMAHHQGMSLAALDNVLNGEAMERRFHAELRVRAFETLLFERVPIARQPEQHLELHRVAARARHAEESRSWQEPALVPRAHLNGNGRYFLAATNSGAGFSRWYDFDITRWRSDSALHPWGSYIYLRDLKSFAVWSATSDPAGADLGSSSVLLAADRIQYIRRVTAIDTTLHLTVAPEDDVEIRRIAVVNRSLRTRHIELTSYAELALAPHRTDSAHPAFAKMFVETECPEEGVLLAHRRPRSPDETPIWAAHVILGATGSVQFETDRAQFLGRGNTPANPRALRRDLSGSAGAVLDPIFSLRCRLTIEARARREVVFLTFAASSRDALMALIEKYRRAEAVTRAFEMAWTRSQLEMRYLGVRPGAAHRYHELAGRLLYPDDSLRTSPARLARNHLGQSALWAYGISGDLPILAVTASDARGVALVREVLLAHNYWRLLGFKADLVILNQEEPSYESPLREQLRRQIEAHSRGAIDTPGGVFLRDWNSIPEDHRNLILAAATVVLHGNRGALHQQLVPPGGTEPPAPFVPSGGAAEQPSPPLPFLELPYFNGVGGFTKDGREYCIYLGRESERTPAPWINVIANPNFGTMVSESGLGCTWNRNSQSNRLTPWHNDPVSDPQSEAIYLRDEETGALWTPTALPIRENDAYRARHGQGYTVFEHNSHAIEQKLTVFVAPADPVKICRLSLRNDSSRARRLAVTYFAEWVLGSVREDQQLHISTSFDEASGALIASQTWSGSTAGYVAFAAANPRANSWSGDRSAFLGRDGSRVKPFALGRVHLDGCAGPGLDPAAALQLNVALEPNATIEITFVLGQSENLEAARGVIARAFSTSLQPVHDQWESLCGALQVHTPVLSVDLLLNRWLLYQALSCRFWGRTAFYQSSGAFGFRDQLQDSLAFLYAAPHLTREHILMSAARQFPEGDVQHWWHADTGLGVRTRCSDDMLWLPYAVAQYVEVTGDAAILDQPVPFLDGPRLEEKEQEKMFAAAASAESASLWEHCRRALEHAGQSGAHDLPLIGNGDWNDGLNRIGIEGRGESVWLAWFLAVTLQSFARLMQTREPNLAKLWRSRAENLAAAADRSAWDGEWYLRGFFDDGSPFGSSRNTEMRIDSIAQSWAVLCGLGDPARARTAMDSADHLLVNERDRLVMLFTPPFDHSTPNPGYIMGYPPGVRENGGQYTHGSLWLAMAQARLGDGDRAVHLLQLMNPIEHSRDSESAARYAAEPYVSAADVYSSPAKSGRAGWTWYTGSAAWMYRIWIEEVLGLHLRGDRLSVDPAIPDDWPGFSVTIRYRSSVYQIEVVRSDEAPSGAAIPLLDDGATHSVTVRIPVAGRVEKFQEPAAPVADPIAEPAALEVVRRRN